MFGKFKFLVLLVLVGSVSLFGEVLVPIAKKNISSKEKIFSYDVTFVPESKKYFCRKYIDMNLLNENKYLARHFIRKGRAICERNVIVPESNVVRFQFGNLEIEKEGKVIRETDRYIKIKNLDGTINKIYKDGRN